MTEQELEWMISGDCVEGCTSPPVCPAYWNSPLQAQLHQGRSECEGVWAFRITQGYHGDTDLSGVVALYAFNTPSPFPPPERIAWKCIIFIDEKANTKQAEALEEIFRKCWEEMGDVIAVKRAAIEFEKELLDGGPASRYTVRSEGLYHLVTRPFRTQDGEPRYINSRSGGLINIGVSQVNEFNDADLPRGKWNVPGMSITYYDFILSPHKLAWLP